MRLFRTRQAPVIERFDERTIVIAPGAAIPRQRQQQETSPRVAPVRRAALVRTASPARRGRKLLPPSDYQVYRMRALAMTRELQPDIITTRAERFAVINAIIGECKTRKDANHVLAVLRTLSPARFARWEERTARFKWAHDNQTRRLEGRPEIPWERPRHAAVAVRYGAFDQADQALVDTMVYGWRPNRPTRAELVEYHAACVIRDDPDWGPILVSAP